MTAQHATEWSKLVELLAEIEDHYASSAFDGQTIEQFEQRMKDWGGAVVAMAKSLPDAALDEDEIQAALSETIAWFRLAADDSHRRAWAARRLAHVICRLLGID